MNPQAASWCVDRIEALQQERAPWQPHLRHATQRSGACRHERLSSCALQRALRRARLRERALGALRIETHRSRLGCLWRHKLVGWLVVCVESPPQPATGKEWAMSARVASVLAAERVDDVFLRSGGVHKWAGWDRSNGPPSRMQQRAVAHAAKPAASHPEPRHCNRPVSRGTHGIFGWASRIRSMNPKQTTSETNEKE